MRSEHLRQALVHLRGLVRAAADHDDALLAQACLHGRPVDEAAGDLLLHPHLAQARGRMVGADALLRHAGRRADAVDVEDAVAVAVRARPALAAPHAARRLGAAHHATGTVDGRVQRLAGHRALGALQDHRVVAHRAADEALLTGTRRRAALAHHPVGAAEVSLLEREVVVVVHVVHGLRAEDVEHLRHDDVAAGVRVVTGQAHRRDVGLSELGVELEEHRRRVHLALVRACVERETLREREEARGGLVAEATRAEMHPDPDRAGSRPPSRLHVVACPSSPCRAEHQPGLHQLALRRELRVADRRRAPGGPTAPPAGHAHAERDPPGRISAHDPLDAAQAVEVCARQLCPNAALLRRSRCRSRTPDGRHVALVGDRAADRGLAVAHVVVGAQGLRRNRHRPLSCSARAARGSVRPPRRTS